ncbi:MAG: phospho-sugar mutase [Myxococcota bacterium]|nr:phospho-sugar mutase [Myxococcota bacterium]MDW8361506.1 phospho-sugar mutase [Myxococcales bacterium]
MAAVPETLRARVQAWIDDDPDPETRDELRALLAEENRAALEERFGPPLSFGTAGLRGLLGAGPSRMNRRVVLRTTAGLCAYLQQHVPDAVSRGVCIGYDGRRNSRLFAEDVAAAVAGAGFRAWLFDRMVPTPLLAFAVRDRGAAAGVMITASHNPPDYNGYKVFWGNGAQIVPPHDEGISRCIESAPAVADLPRLSLDDAIARGLLEPLGEPVVRRYLDAVAALSTRPPRPEALVIAYTALHGVGEPYLRAVLGAAGFRQLHSVAEQAEPDGRFPTVVFPNPEEAGAMDLVLALGERVGADLVLANDPDADRLAVAARDRSGRLAMLGGNDVGCLIGHHLLTQGSPTERRFVLSTLVSSPLLGAIARAHGAHWEQTLTGFKWIAHRAMELEASGHGRFVMGYEEALGYCVGDVVRDKDGISSALVVAEMAAALRAQGRTLHDELEACWRRYGMVVSRQVSLVRPGTAGLAEIAERMQRARAARPQALGETRVLATVDLQQRLRHLDDGRHEPVPLPAADVLLFELEGGHRAMLRPSGTEPKLKMYFDVRVDVGADEPIESARLRADERLTRLESAVRTLLGL